MASSSGDKKTGRIRTLADLNRQSGLDDSDDEPQEYYTGGEKSGMLVQDPSKFNDVDAIFNQARRLGASQEPIEQIPPSSSSSFVGTSRMLSDDAVPSSPPQPVPVIHDIVFWTNGFTVNDGPLRKFDDPENASFLESIAKSGCPKELEPEDRRSTVHVKLIRRDRMCPEPENSGPLPFQGLGRTLGSSSSASQPVEPAPAGTSSMSSSGPAIDSSLPSTSIQVRLADGTRMVTQLNHHHTVNDLRAAINASRPGVSQNYHLQLMGFPPKLLSDPNQTIEQANLANSVVIQKF